VGVPYGTNNTGGDYYSFTIRDTASGDRVVIRWDIGNVGIGTNNPQALPTVIFKTGCLRCWAARFLPWRVAG
jgi:hypothetical protein